MFEFWNTLYTRHTFWSCLIRCAIMKWIQWVWLKIQSRHDSIHRRTDRLEETSIQLRWSWGDIITNCCDEIFHPTLIHVASRIARITIWSKQDRSWNPIRSRNRELLRNYWSNHVISSDRIVSWIGTWCFRYPCISSCLWG